MRANEIAERIVELSAEKVERGVLTQMEREEADRKERRELTTAVWEVAFHLARLTEILAEATMFVSDDKTRRKFRT